MPVGGPALSPLLQNWETRKGPDVWVVNLLLEVGARVYCCWWVNRYLECRLEGLLGPVSLWKALSQGLGVCRATQAFS